MTGTVMLDGRCRSDRGSVATEMVIVTPIALALLCLVALVGRTSSARDTVNNAARTAARSASFERNPAAATAAATQAANDSLNANGFHCAGQTVTADVSSYGPGGQVAVTVTCQVKLSDLGLLGLGGTKDVSATAVEVIDRYKAVSDGFSNSEGSSGGNSR